MGRGGQDDLLYGQRPRSISRELRDTRSVTRNGVELYYKPGTEVLHREDGPAVIVAPGRQFTAPAAPHGPGGMGLASPAKTLAEGEYWFADGLLHNEDGPAFLPTDGEAEHWQNGLRDWEADDVEVVDCKFCLMPGPEHEAHLHQGDWVGECCWDDRLASTA